MNNQQIFIILAALFALPGVMTAADFRTKTEITMPVDSTVANVLCSTQNGHTGFNMPLAPQFTSRKLWQALPTGMSEYPALYKTDAATLTTASMVRFIQQGHILFTDKKAQDTYKKAVQTCITAHKKWYTAPYSENLRALHQAEHAVFELLKTLHLNDKHVRTTLQNILSTPINEQSVAAFRTIENTLGTIIKKKGLCRKEIFSLVPKTLATLSNNNRPTLCQFLSSSTLPWRSWIQVNKTGEMVVQTSRIPTTVLKNFVTSFAITFPVRQIVGYLENLIRGYGFSSYYHGNATTINPWIGTYYEPPHATTSMFAILNAAWIIYLSTGFYGWFTDFKLTPEPESGIKVILTLAPAGEAQA